MQDIASLYRRVLRPFAAPPITDPAKILHQEGDLSRDAKCCLLRRHIIQHSAGLMDPISDSARSPGEQSFRDRARQFQQFVRETFFLETGGLNSDNWSDLHAVCVWAKSRALEGSQLVFFDLPRLMRLHEGACDVMTAMPTEKAAYWASSNIFVNGGPLTNGSSFYTATSQNCCCCMLPRQLASREEKYAQDHGDMVSLGCRWCYCETFIGAIPTVTREGLPHCPLKNLHTDQDFLMWYTDPSTGQKHAQRCNMQGISKFESCKRIDPLLGTQWRTNFCDVFFGAAPWGLAGKFVPLRL